MISRTCPSGQQIIWDVEVHGAWTLGESESHQTLCLLAGVILVQHFGRFGKAHEHLRVVHKLKRHARSLSGRVGLREAQDGVSFPQSEAGSADKVGCAGAHDRHADAARAGEFARDDGRHGSRSLVLNENEGNVDFAGGLDEVYRASAAGNAEHARHSAAL